MKWLIGVVLFAVAGFAGAGTATIHLAWIAPTTRTDGTLLLISSLDHYTLYYTCDTGRAGNVIVTPGTLTSVDLTGDWLGKCIFTLSVTDTGRLESALSAPANVLIKLNKPASGGFKHG